MLGAITVTFGWWLIPTIITIPCLCLFLKGLFAKPSGWFDMGPILSFLFLIPSLLSWTIYLGIRVIFNH